MFTLKDLARAINLRLSAAVSEIPIVSTDIREGFHRPSFYVDFDEATKAPRFDWAVERNVQVTIYFFPTSQYDYQLEMLDIQDRVESAFTGTLDLAPGGAFKAWIDEVSTIRVDGVLQTSFEIHYVEDKDDDGGADADMMEELSLDVDLE
ncbi:DUF6838 family protein [Paenibacillus sp. TAB 01]|uniref:phage tail terminator family protein n=1 Tax=Paenibacillus sp. TAB 01 TaxID=3368988 RepID=UPI003752C46E